MKKYTELLEKAVFDIKGVVEQKVFNLLFQIDKPPYLKNTVTD